MSDFWSRRRASVEAESHADDAAQAEALQAAAAAEIEARPDADLLHDAGLPEPEELGSAEDVRNFLKAELPQRLKTRALRQLWRLNPALANLDGLVDYGEDFTDSATVVENLQTVYQVGKGMFVKLEEMAAEPPEINEDEDEDGPAPDMDGAPRETIVEPAPVAVMAEAEEHPEPDYETLPAPARRMRFHFET